MGHGDRHRSSGEMMNRMAFCRCGDSRRINPDGAAMPIASWYATHHGDGHRVAVDGYRADCGPLAGCRLCGVATAGRFEFYCSAQHRDEFERDHFWSSARRAAILAAARGSTLWVAAYCCARCHTVFPTVAGVEAELRAAGVQYDHATWLTIRRTPAPEVNHIMPVNGQRAAFDCQHHRDNLEVLCHSCHVATTATQRAAGLIGRRL